jgi:hypothetical protein
VTSGGEVLEALELFEGSDPTNVCIAGGTLWVTLGVPGVVARMPLQRALA